MRFLGDLLEKDDGSVAKGACAILKTCSRMLQELPGTKIVWLEAYFRRISVRIYLERVLVGNYDTKLCIPQMWSLGPRLEYISARPVKALSGLLTSGCREVHRAMSPFQAVACICLCVQCQAWDNPLNERLRATIDLRTLAAGTSGFFRCSENRLWFGHPCASRNQCGGVPYLFNRKTGKAGRDSPERSQAGFVFSFVRFRFAVWTSASRREGRHPRSSTGRYCVEL